jgi:cytochrome b subunit of formate dehydrogenase
MFNPGKKLLAWALSISVAVVVVTGIVAWSAHTWEGGLHGAAVVLTALRWVPTCSWPSGA